MEDQKYTDEEIEQVVKATQMGAPLAGRKTRVRAFPKVHRNDECPCGSGLKFKKCCIVNFKSKR